jgi:phosphate:Na+ symporter
MMEFMKICRFLFAFSLFFFLGSILSASESAHEFIRQLPDQRVPFQPGGVNTTVLQLREPYQKIDDLQDITPVFAFEDSGTTEIVEPEIKDGKLLLHWKGLGTSNIILRIENPQNGHVFYDRIRLETWAPQYGMMFFVVLGGIGIFLLGMKYLSDGLQLVAGAGLRKMIATVTENRLVAVLVGIIVTVTIQSSTATTVMVVGFVNSQIMTLAQGIGVIMGANIGTTITGWLLTLSLSKYGLPILGGAALVYLFTKTERTRLLAMVVMGIGCVFFGLDLMQHGFVTLRELPAFSKFIEQFSADTFGGVWLCILWGCAMTIILQASSATLGITISLASLGVIPFETAAALVLGENIGTTLTALLASIGSSPNARRAAFFHLLFNISGVIWVSLLFRIIFLPCVYWVVGTDPATGLIKDPKVGIALTHSLFNVTNTILFLPFIQVIAGFLERFIVGSGGEEAEGGQTRLTTLAVRRLETPTMAIERSRIEVIRMGNICLRLSEKVTELMDSVEKPEQKVIDSAFHQEEELDTLQDEIIAYTSSLLSGNISHDLGEAAHQQLRMADELESISDYLIVILKSHLKMQKDGLDIPEPQKSEFKDLHSATESYLAMVIRYYSARRTDFADLTTEVHAQGGSINRKAKGTRDQFVKRMSEEKFDPQVVIAFNTQFNAYRRVREHTQNVAEAIIGAK